MSNKVPLVSIIMPAYNSSHTIRDSIQSVCQQTYPNWELLVVDDCSTEDIAAIVREFPDSRIRGFITIVYPAIRACQVPGIRESKKRRANILLFSTAMTFGIRGS